jgi:hypothetical protein
MPIQAINSCGHPHRCRPGKDHDLVLRDGAGRPRRFEVSDVASENDGNGKEKKNLTSLGILHSGGEIPGWPDGRHPLVVSS